MKKIFAVLFIFVMVMSSNVSAFAAGHKLNLKEAKKVAVDFAGVNEKDAVFTREHKAYDNGRQVFDLEFHVGNTEYDMDVDVNTGRILDYSMEYFESYRWSSSTRQSSSTTQSRFYDDDDFDDDFDDLFDWDD